MCMYKAGMILSVELIVIAAGFYFLYLAKKENSKHLKIGGYILAVGGILIALTTAAMTIKHMGCGKRQCKMVHGGDRAGGYHGKVRCDKEEAAEKAEVEEEKY